MREISTTISFGGYRSRFLAIFLCTLPLFAEGGIQGVPPWPNQQGPELAVNGDFEDMTGWNLSTCGSQDAGTGVGGSNSLEITGGNCTVWRQFTSPDETLYPWIEIRAKIRRDATSDGQLTFRVKDGTLFAPVGTAFNSVLGFTTTDRMTELIVAPSGDYIDVFTIIAHGPYLGGDTGWRIELFATNWTAGSMFVDELSIKGSNYPLYNFVKYPNNKGYLWSGYDSWLCDGADVDEACGFVDVRPPTGTAIADTYVEIHHDTTAGCASPTATVTVQPTVQRTDWQVDLSAIADDATVFICAQLRLDSDDSLIADFPDWKIIKRTTAWRTTNLEHWVDDYGRWIDGTLPRFMWMTYQRLVGGNCPTNCLSTNVNHYLELTGHGNPGRKLWPDFTASGRNVSLYFSPMSGVDPRDGTDQFTPWLNVLNTLGLRYWHIANGYFGELMGRDAVEDGDEAPSAPTVVCSSTGGSISDAWVYVKISGVGGRMTLQSNAWTVETEASASDHDGPLTGSTNSCVVTMPAFTPSGAIGYWVYADGAASESQPANGSYSLQTTRFVEPGESITLTEILDTQKEPFTVSLGSSPGELQNIRSGATWIPTTETTEDVLARFSTRAAGNSALLGYYLCDECLAYDAGNMYTMMNWLRTNDPGRINMALPMEVRSFSGVDWFYSAILDVNAQDIYYEDVGDTAENRRMQPDSTGSGRSATCYAFAGRNATASYNNLNLNLVDQWTDDKMRSHDGSRMNVPVVQQWGRDSSNCWGWTEDEQRKQIWKSVIGVQNWGMIGGVGTWGWVSVQGLDRFARIPPDLEISGSDSRGNTQALDDDIRVGAQMMAIEHVLIEPVDESSQLGWGSILDGAPTSSITLPTATCGGWTDPIRALAKTMDNGDVWIFATNLCKDSQTMTFSLANATGKIAVDYFTGATYTLTGGDFDVASTDFGVHVIQVKTPTGGGIRGR